jgi:hypothetical protein
MRLLVAKVAESSSNRSSRTPNIAYHILACYGLRGVVELPQSFLVASYPDMLIETSSRFGLYFISHNYGLHYILPPRVPFGEFSHVSVHLRAVQPY